MYLNLHLRKQANEYMFSQNKFNNIIFIILLKKINMKSTIIIVSITHYWSVFYLYYLKERLLTYMHKIWI